MGLGQPSVPQHHWRASLFFGDCFGWDLLWVGPGDDVISEMIVESL